MNRRLLRLIEDKNVRRSALLVALWLPAVVILVVVREVLLPFVLAFLLSYVIAPVVRRLSSIEVAGRRLPRWGSVLVLYAGIATLLWLFGAFFVPQLYREGVRLAKDGTALFNELDDEHIAAMSARLELWLDVNDIPVRIVTPRDDAMEAQQNPRAIAIDLVDLVQGFVHDAKAQLLGEATKVVGQLQALVAGLVRLVFSTFLVLMLTAFLAAETERITNFLFTITPLRDRSTLEDLLTRIDRGLSGVVRGQLTICVINGVLTLVGLLLLHVKFAFLMATVAAVLSLVPIFGSILSTIPIVFVALSNGLSTALLAVLWIVGIHALEANLLNPKIMGEAAKIHPVLVVLALIIGEHYYGISGALLAVPIMSVLVTVFKAARARAMELDAEVIADELAGLRHLDHDVRRRRLHTQDGG